MNKPFAIALVTAQVVLVAGVAVIGIRQGESQDLLDRNLRGLDVALEGQEKNIRDLDQGLGAVSKQVDASVAGMQSLSERLDRLGSKEEMARLEEALTKLLRQMSANSQAGQEILKNETEAAKKQLDTLSAKIDERPPVKKLRWAYVDKFKLRRVAAALEKPQPLTPEQDPDQSPELAKKLAEYNSVQYKLAQLDFRPEMPPWNRSEASPANEKKQKEYEALQLKLAELKPPLAAYLRNKSGNSSSQDQMIDAAIRKFAEGQFDLLVDKTFGDHHIYFRSADPVPDVTDAVEQVLRKMPGGE